MRNYFRNLIIIAHKVIPYICYLAGVTNQIKTGNTTETLCWVTLGTLIGVTDLEVK